MRYKGEGERESCSHTRPAPRHPPHSPLPPITVAARASAIPALLAAAALAPALSQATLASLLRTAPGNAARDEAVKGGACEAALTALKAALPRSDAWAAAASLASALATKHEGAKAAFVGGGLGGLVASALPSATDAGVEAAASALSACARADDARPLTSSAFQHGRALAHDGALPTALLAVLADTARSADAVSAAATACKRILVNDDLVRAFAGLAAWGGEGERSASSAGGGGSTRTPTPGKDGVAATLAALARGSSDPTPAGTRLARAACALARQLAGSDALKPGLVGGGALAAVAALVPRAAAASAHGLVEQALGLVTALALRNPAASEAAVAAGCVPAIVAALTGPVGGGAGAVEVEVEVEVVEDEEDENAHPAPPAASSTTPSTAATKAHQWALRQACAATRNLASRAAPDGPVLAALSSARLTPLLRAARRRYPDACGDVGAAALRDLGVEDYNAA